MNLKPPTDIGQRRLNSAYRRLRQARRAHATALAITSGTRAVPATEDEWDMERTLRKALATACDAYEAIYAEVIG